MLIAGFIICASLTAVDGDTIKCDGENMRIMGAGKPFISGVDTPELRGKCDEEKKLAREAKQRTAELLKTPGLRVEFSGERDTTRTKRPLVWLRLPQGVTVGEVLIREGLAREWRPGQKIDWCSR